VLTSFKSFSVQKFFLHTETPHKQCVRHFHSTSFQKNTQVREYPLMMSKRYLMRSRWDMRRFKSKDELEQERQEQLRYLPGAQTVLPIDKLLLIYGRQSTVKQFVQNRESAEQQAIDLLDYALSLGWPEQLRQLFIENQLNDGTIKNASGRLRIDLRPGLSEVVALIETGTVGAVLVRAIDRLFRDETMVGPVVFANLCKEHHVLILTMDDLYDFNHPRTGDEHYNKFLMAALEAKNYIQKHIRGVMLRNRERKAMRGEFSGHAVPTGFMLDDNRLFYVPNPIWAPVMSSLLKRYKALDANFAALRREIIGYPIFPDLPEDIKKRVGRVQLTKVAGGYTVKSYDALRMMLTNVALIGHIAYNGRIVKKHAHPAIVDEADFWYAFDRLSPTTIEGEPILGRKAVRRHSKYETGALLAGTRDTGVATIMCPVPGCAVYIQPQTRRTGVHSYAYVLRDNSRVAVSKDVASIGLATLDTIFLNRFLERLDTYKTMQEPIEVVNGGVLVWQAIGAAMRNYVQYHDLPTNASPFEKLQQMYNEDAPAHLVSLPALIAQAKHTIEQLQREYKVNFDLMTDAEIRENKAQRVQLAQDIEEMERKQKRDAATEQDKRDVDALLENVYGLWPTFKREKQRRFIRLVTRSIELAVVADGWLVLRLVWSPYLGYEAVDTAFIWQQGGAGKVWSDAEETILQDMYPTAERTDILRALPTRSWTSISGHAYLFGLKRLVRRWSFDLPREVSVTDQQIMEEYGLGENPLRIQSGNKAKKNTYCWWQVTMKPTESPLSGRNEWCP
jgi:hypothetical protein